MTAILKHSCQALYIEGIDSSLFNFSLYSRIWLSKIYIYSLATAFCELSIAIVFLCRTSEPRVQ